MLIGEFARLGGVSIRMLRHYDALGLLCPERVDAQTGYRHYAAGQLATLKDVLLLRDFSLTLDEISVALTLDEAGLTSLLVRQRAAIAARLADEQRRLARLDAHLSASRLERLMPEHHIEVRPLPALHVASLRDPSLVIQPDTGGQDMTAMWELLREKLPQSGREDGTTILWHDSGEIDLPEPELLHPITVTTVPPPPLRARDLEAAPRAATLVYVGHYAEQGMIDAFAALHAWVESSGETTAGPMRQVFRGAERLDGRTRFTIELQQPLA